MYKTASIFLKDTHKLFDKIDQYAFLCKNLKNSILYMYRQEFFTNGVTLNKYAVINTLTKGKQQDYIAIPRKVSQQIVFQVAREFQSFWGLLKARKNNDSIGRPQLPRYLDKTKGRANVIFTKQAVSKKGFSKGLLIVSPFDKELPIEIPLGNLSDVITYDDLQEVRFVKVQNGYDVKIIYKASECEALETSKERYVSIDLGVNNLMSLGNNFGASYELISGRALKSFNQYYNKKLAKLRSLLDTCKEFQKNSIKKKIERLHRKRKHKVQDFLHRASRYVINHAVSNGVETLVIGYNKGWKQEINIGTTNNQKFVSIPHSTLLNMISYKAQEFGIEVITTEESYTSKCSFLDSEELKKHIAYKGSRLKRGLFRSSEGRLLNADINGSLNILRKVIGDFQYDPVQVCSTPKTINVLKL